MGAFVAALALAGALFPFAPAQTPEQSIRLAQMPRDVTGAVRKQRDRPRERTRTDNRTTREGGR